MSQEQPQEQYRVFVNNGKDGMHDIVDFDELQSLAYFHLCKREEARVEFTIVALESNGKRLDGISKS